MSLRHRIYAAIGALTFALAGGLVLLLNLRVAPHAPQDHSTAQLVVTTPTTSSSTQVGPSASPPQSNSAPSPGPRTTPMSPPQDSSPTPTATPTNVGQENVPIIYDRSGQGNLVTEDFQVPAQWIIYWSYACPNADTSAGRLQVSIYRKGIDMPIKTFSTPAGRSSGPDYNYVGDGWYHLSIQTACSWRITVTPAPGFTATPTPSP